MAQQQDRGRRREPSPEEQEYRRRLAVKERKRKERVKQQLILLGGFLLAIILLAVCVVMIVRSVRNPKQAAGSSSVSSSLSALEPGATQIALPQGASAGDPYLVIINNQVPMLESYNPELETVDAAGHWFMADVKDQLLAMMEACNAETGGNLAVNSGYRSPERQDERYAAVVDSLRTANPDWTDTQLDEAARRIEPPGRYSDHQTGLAVDFVCDTAPQPDAAFASTEEYVWLLANAPQYGFVLRFPESKQDITGIDFQPYHFRYVGVENAKAITAAGVCLEEYVDKLVNEATPLPMVGIDDSASSSASA